MPGVPFLMVSDSYQDVQREGVPSQSGGGSSLGWGFYIWLVVIGLVIPVVILGSLRAGGLQFAFRRR